MIQKQLTVQTGSSQTSRARLLCLNALLVLQTEMVTATSVVAEGNGTS